jgi:hypothetical protein
VPPQTILAAPPAPGIRLTPDTAAPKQPAHVE